MHTIADSYLYFIGSSIFDRFIHLIEDLQSFRVNVLMKQHPDAPIKVMEEPLKLLKLW